MYKTIVLAYDGSEAGQRALLDCQEIGQWSQAQLHLVAVMPPPVAMIAGEAWAYSPAGDNEEKARYQEVLDQGISRLRAAGLDVRGEVVTGISVDDLLASSLNHRKEVSKVFEVQVPKRQLAQGHQVTVGLKFEDRQGNAIGEGQSFAIELQSRSDIEKLLLSLKFHIQGK